ncbi:tetraacyldisaccharide 4'-kinase [Azospirillum sp. RWY-5-1]|uniref:Tetraacyldisaccharide 4'-kinase n=1 Tax=Azospirillum oleiclasticum TaxID=2735135 RepID=A0ABX2T325_9PROT|nr:tetraacyldisaccharide 4'-kinase [Azospirillum oleiclasticum]NYZ11365.1 tetraacyldisaccharide 4'-kinase [Azospirillum oleiclasticum]NYZ18526.1 tetraacyldisaccharide 4'-kinase [Azospirillum oleiclasticum]
MRTPGFWYRPAGALAALLAPLGMAYGLGGRLRMGSAMPVQAGVPVVCVGNLVAGGAGKTPVALAVMDGLARRGIAAHFLTRGHGGRERGPLRVDPGRHDHAAVGDEALLLARRAPCWLARDRAAGAAAAVADGAEGIVMDDGFQNPGLAKDLSLVVVDGGAGFGNGRLIPAGPLREPVARGLARADALVILGHDETRVSDSAGALPILRARLEPAPEAQDLRGRTVLAFAGIGRPAKFFETLRRLGAVVAAAIPFPDHHPYAPEEAMRLLELAQAAGAIPVTTEKDAVRLPAEVRDQVQVVRVSVSWENPSLLDGLLARILAPREAA